MTSFNLNYVFKGPDPNTVTLRVGASVNELGRGREDTIQFVIKPKLSTDVLSSCSDIEDFD